MYTTVSVKDQWQTVFRCGNTANPEEVILILGSCRVVPYINYLDHANTVWGNKFLIYCVDPINFQVDAAGNHLDTAGLLKALETDEHFLNILKSVTIFLHEWLESFGILNTSRDIAGNIYAFDLAPKIDVTIPNFHDIFLMAEDIKKFHPNMSEDEMVRLGDENLDRFVSICDKSSFPEFGQWFRDNYLEKRLFHSFNHVSSNFTLEIFRLMNEKFLKLPLDEAFWAHIGQQDIYANVQTPVTDLDRKWRPFKFA